MLKIKNRQSAVSQQVPLEKKPIQTKKGKKKKSILNYLLFPLLFLVGFGVFAYPFLSNWYYTVESKQLIHRFDDAKSRLLTKEVQQRMQLAHQYNQSLSDLIYDDPYDDEQKKEGRRAYAEMLEIKEYIGHVEIPRIGEDLPIFAGTSEEILQKGTGHLEGTSLPVGGKNTHTVITAHTGLPKMRLFTDLTKVKEGDVFFIHNLAETLAYQVDQITVIEPTDFQALEVIPGGDYATLLTCTPYMVNTHRLLVRGHRIPYEKKTMEKVIQLQSYHWFWDNLYLVGAILFALIAWCAYLIWSILAKSRKKKHIEKGN